LKKELNVLTQARDDLMSSMKLLKEQLGGSGEGMKAQLEQLANEKQEYREQNDRMLEKIKVRILAPVTHVYCNKHVTKLFWTQSRISCNR
jgi:hypothetical protein